MISRGHVASHRFGNRRWIPFMIIFAPVLAVLAGGLIMLLWNWLMPMIFGLSEINLWMALGIFLLTRILFGSFHHDKHRSYHKYHRDLHHPGFAEWWEKEGRKKFEDHRQSAEKE